MRRCAASAALCSRALRGALPAAAGGQLFDRAVQPVQAEPGAEAEMRPRDRAGAGARELRISCTRSGATRSGSSAARLSASRAGNPWPA